MRVTCPCCHERFDIPHRAIIAEAERLAEMRRRGKAIPDDDNTPTGNVLAPDDAEAKRLRDEAIARRMQSK